MSWILLATGAQFILAGVALIDKYIVSDEKILPRPFVYAFYSCLIAGSWAIIFLLGLLPIPFTVPSFANVARPSLELVALSVLAAYTFFIALTSMFSALKQADTSDVIPVVGAVSAIGTFGLGYFFLNTELSASFVWGITLLVTGTFLASHFRFPIKTAMLSVHSGLFFALYWVSTKGLFNASSNFDDGFFWSRMGFVFIALSLLLIPSYWQKITEQTKSTTKSAGFLILANKLMAGIATILILKATSMKQADVAVIQALGGLQFVFLLLFGVFFGRLLPKSCGENESPKDSALQKAIFVAIIVLGFIMLFK